MHNCSGRGFDTEFAVKFANTIFKNSSLTNCLLTADHLMRLSCLDNVSDKSEKRTILSEHWLR
jgi:hypothetical protein